MASFLDVAWFADFSWFTCHGQLLVVCFEFQDSKYVALWCYMFGPWNLTTEIIFSKDERRNSRNPKIHHARFHIFWQRKYFLKQQKCRVTTAVSSLKDDFWVKLTATCNSKQLFCPQLNLDFCSNCLKTRTIQAKPLFVFRKDAITELIFFYR